MTAGERAVWAAVYAAAYLDASCNTLLGDQIARSHAAHKAACLASDALAGIRKALATESLPSTVEEHAGAVLKGPPR